MSAILAKPDFDLTQILNGVPFMAPSPFGIHQSIVSNLHLLLGSLVKSKKLGKLFVSPLDVILESELNVVQPDLIFIKNENMSIFHPNGHIHGIPDLLIEIVSSGSVTRDTVEKFQIYEKYGVPEYWIVFPEQKVIEVFSYENSKYQLHYSSEKATGSISSKVISDLTFPIESIFS
jgi:Uma2 family endonuclease